jgi:LDH2 family malate/lactate/ureidoglycolate dehydrogenase
MGKQWYNVIVDGKLWYGHLSAEDAAREAIRARRLGIGMAYVELATN